MMLSKAMLLTICKPTKKNKSRYQVKQTIKPLKYGYIIDIVHINLHTQEIQR